MNSRKDEAIKILEELGYEVMLSKNNKVVYSKYCREQKYCDNCQYLTFEQNRDPFDSFSIDFRAKCQALDVKIEGGLEFYETKNILKPLACPLLGRELSEEEEKEVEKWFEMRKAIEELEFKG